MAQRHENITDDLRNFIEAQHMFFVASAPLAAAGHVNVSPKGLDCLRVLSPHRVAYLDLTGSGNETSAHLRENGRITLMFCAFQGAPRILRLFGQGRTVLPGDADWAQLQALFPQTPGARQVIVADIDIVQTACGFGVPLFEFGGQRDMLPKWAQARGAQGLATYREQKNLRSIDGLLTPLGERAGQA